MAMKLYHFLRKKIDLQGSRGVHAGVYRTNVFCTPGSLSVGTFFFFNRPVFEGEAGREGQMIGETPINTLSGLAPYQHDRTYSLPTYPP